MTEDADSSNQQYEMIILPSTVACKPFFRDRLWLTAAATGREAVKGPEDEGGFVRLIGPGTAWVSGTYGTGGVGSNLHW